MTENSVNHHDTQPTSYLVKGCPCLMEFGTEQICINNDEITPIYFLDVSKEMALESIRDSQRSNEASYHKDPRPCYGIVDVGRSDGVAYCALHGEPLRINGVPIRSSDIEDAIQFSIITENEQVCSSCIYKYLVTMGGVFEEEISSDEAHKLIEAYIVHSQHIPHDRSHTDERMTGVTYRSVLRAHLRELIEEKRVWSSYISRQSVTEGTKTLHELLELYRRTSRMEMVLHYQLLALYEHERGPTTQPRLIRKTAARLVSLCSKIQEINNRLLSSEIPPETESMIRTHMLNRERIEEGIRALLVTMDSRKSSNSAVPS
ncbi:MAG: hypothetical protein K9W43_03065 [Candidatus Thorarchaeota archaeon]|nr:hypothetical protein [Candidatus Thorarchaeota archaeon]